eukprot:11017-Pelagococcus_subviridis.AAC.1
MPQRLRGGDPRARVRTQQLPKQIEPAGRGRAQTISRRLAQAPEGASLRRAAGAEDGVERRRGRVLKAWGGRRDATAKVLKEWRSPRQRGRMGTSV